MLLIYCSEVFNLKKLVFSSLILLFLNACQTHFPILSENDVPDRRVSEKTACQENIESSELADIDYLLYANKMIDSMTRSEQVQKETANSRMRVYLSPVSHSRDDVDMSVINTSIKNRILRSGLFVVVDDMGAGEFQLSGAFKEIQQTDDSSFCNKNYEEFSLQLKNRRSNAILWSDKKQIN